MFVPNCFTSPLTLTQIKKLYLQIMYTVPLTTNYLQIRLLGGRNIIIFTLAIGFVLSQCVIEKDNIKKTS